MEFSVDITKKSIDVLSGVFQAGSTFSDVSKIISASASLASAFPVVSAALVLIGSFVPGSEHEKVIRGIQNLGNKIGQVRNDIEHLKFEILYDISMQLYANKETAIELGIQHLFMIASATGINEKRMYQKKLNDTCALERCTLDLNALLAGVNGGSLFRHSILNKYYDKTGGNRKEMSALAKRLLQLICSGIAVVSTYERMVHGKVGAAGLRMTLDPQWRSACASVESALDKCTNKFEENMLKDLNRFLDRGGSNEGLVTEISNFMRDKYDWLENYCLVYNDVHGSDKHWFSGYWVASLHRNEKCGIVYYRMKDETPMFSDRHNEVDRIVYATRCYGVFYHTYAQECQESIVATLNRRGIGWTGCAVITKYYGSDLRQAGTFATSTVVANIYELPQWGYSRDWAVTATGIVLLD